MSYAPRSSLRSLRYASQKYIVYIFSVNLEREIKMVENSKENSYSGIRSELTVLLGSSLRKLLTYTAS